MSEKIAYKYLLHKLGFITCRKILRYGTAGFTSPPKEVLLRILVHCPRPGFDSRTLGPMASTITARPPRRSSAHFTGSAICQLFTEHKHLLDVVISKVHHEHWFCLLFPDTSPRDCQRMRNIHYFSLSYHSFAQLRWTCLARRAVATSP
jgi:hypothetical protein